MEEVRAKISFEVTDIKHLPPTKHINCINLSDNPYCITRWERHPGGFSSYDVLCICKDQKIAESIARMFTLNVIKN